MATRNTSWVMLINEIHDHSVEAIIIIIIIAMLVMKPTTIEQ